MLHRLCLLLLAVLPATALADIVTITASGNVDFVSQDPALNPMLGKPMSVTFVYQTPGVNTSADPTIGSYPASLLSYSATLNGQSLTAGTLGDRNLFVTNDAFLSATSQTVDDFEAAAFHTGLALNYTSTLGAGATFDRASTAFVLRDLDHTVYSSLALPTSFDLSQFELKFISTVLQPPLNAFNTRLDATVTNFSISVAVPEPETYAMLLAGLGFLTFGVRRRVARLALAA